MFLKVFMNAARSTQGEASGNRTVTTGVTYRVTGLR